MEEGGEGGAWEGKWEWAKGGCEGWNGAVRGSKEMRCHCVFGRIIRAKSVRVEKKVRSQTKIHYI